MAKEPFKTVSGKDYRAAEKVDLDRVQRWLEEHGLEVERIKQGWRHVTGVIYKNGKKGHVKIASTKGIAEKTINEYEWNLQAAEPLTRKGYGFPLIWTSIEIDGLFGFVSDHLEGETLAEKHPNKDLKNLEDDLEEFAQLAYDITQLTGLELPQDTINERKSLKETNIGYYLWDKASGWHEKTEIYDAQKLVEFIYKRRMDVRTGSAHGDFTPWHVLRLSDGRIALYDGEHAASDKPKYYDVAYAYERLYATLEEPDYAREFLKLFLKLLDNESKTEFEKQFIPVLAQRAVGSYFDAQEDKVEDVRFRKALEKEILAGSIV